MYIAEYILRTFSKKIDRVKSSKKSFGHGAGNGNLNLLRSEFDDFSKLLHNRKVVDFGCGIGHQSVALAKEENCFVCGIDTNTKTLQKAINYAQEMELSEKQVHFSSAISEDMLGSFDVVISKDSMEHFPEPTSTLNVMKSLLKKNGKLLITFGPPWYAPYGSHMHFFCKLPWVNIFFSEKTVMKVRSDYRDDGAKRYEDVESGLNKMTVSKFEKIIAKSGLIMEYKKYTAIKKLNFLCAIPFVRELFINQVSCILSRK